MISVEYCSCKWRNPAVHRRFTLMIKCQVVWYIKWSHNVVVVVEGRGPACVSSASWTYNTFFFYLFISSFYLFLLHAHFFGYTTRWFSSWSYKAPWHIHTYKCSKIDVPRIHLFLFLFSCWPEAIFTYKCWCFTPMRVIKFVTASHQVVINIKKNWL